MFYRLLNIVIVNSFLLSYHAPIAKEDKFSKHRAFRKALCKGLFIHIRPQSIVPIADTVITRVKHQRVKIKRAAYIIYK